VDAGGNIVVGESSSIVTAHMTPSIAHNSMVIIDTSNDAIPSVTEVRFAPSIMDDERALYGPGDVIHIDVIFSQEVTIFQINGINEDDTLPQLILNIISADPGAVHGELVLPCQEGLFSRKLTFRYEVKAGHSQTEVNYVAGDSLQSNYYSIEDAFGRNANLNLPATGSSLSASKTIGVSDVQPRIDSVEADLPAGEYGSGDEVNFILTFDREVAVTGIPKLPLNVRSFAAIYVDGSGTKSLRFLFKALPGDDVERLNVSESTDAELLLGLGDSIALLINAPGDAPLLADPSIEGLSIEQHIAIDTNPPRVTSIIPQASTTPSGTYTVGDKLFFEVSFDKAVVVCMRALTSMFSTIFSSFI
jgi:hypothetical protein